MFSVASWNVNSLRVRLDQVLAWLEREQPDILALQEIKLDNDQFPAAEIEAAGYTALYNGQKTYNGVAILSRDTGEILATDFPGYDDPQRRILGAAYGGLAVLNLYVPNGSEVGSDKYDYKLGWLEQLDAYTRDLLDAWPRCLLVGDFNIAPTDEDVHDPEAWRGKVLCSEPERAAFARLIETGLADCYRLFPREVKEYTWWDYRAAGFRRNRGLRIDHILASSALKDRCRDCRIDIEPRRLDRPSDHAPIIATFDI
ncbi:MAG: exodeoxyribonuclease III [Gammaproteobacteria bacterium]